MNVVEIWRNKEHRLCEPAAEEELTTVGAFLFWKSRGQKIFENVLTKTILGGRAPHDGAVGSKSNLTCSFYHVTPDVTKYSWILSEFQWNMSNKQENKIKGLFYICTLNWKSVDLSQIYTFSDTFNQFYTLRLWYRGSNQQK